MCVALLGYEGVTGLHDLSCFVFASRPADACEMLLRTHRPWGRCLAVSDSEVALPKQRRRCPLCCSWHPNNRATGPSARRFG